MRENVRKKTPMFLPKITVGFLPNGKIIHYMGGSDKISSHNLLEIEKYDKEML